MNNVFNKLSISKKLAAVFMLLLFMMGIGGTVGLYNAVQIAKVTKRLYTESFRRGESLSAVENEFLSARQAMFLHTIVSDAASKSYLKGTIEEHRGKIDKLLDEYRQMGVAGGQDRLYAELTESLDRYWTIHAEVGRLADAGHRDKALGLIRMEGNKTFTGAVNALRKLIKEEKYAAYAAYKESDFFADVVIAVTLVFIFLAVVLVGVLWLMLTRTLVRPILEIEESAKKIGIGNLRQRAPLYADDEIGSLAREFNKMAEGIEDSYATLEHKVFERTEELKLANEELFSKKQELETANKGLLEANRMKSQFLANVSHELRTPLNSIIGFSELLQERAFGELNERQLQYVEYVHSSGGHLLQLINNILDLSKIEAGRMELQTEAFSVTEALGEILGSVRPLAHKRQITISSRTVPASPMLRADKAKFKQIMLNILSNAIKFNVDGGKVGVDWEISEEPEGMSMVRYITFKVSDTGIGIDPEDSGRLFMEFGQLDSSLTREYGGTGLGLALTKRLVELHRGAIWFESAPEKGSVFFIKLPQGTEEIDVPAYAAAAPIAAQEPSVPPASPATGERRLVLIASEGADINHLLEIYLSGGPYECVFASDGVDLLAKARERRPFAILLGVAIPRKDGWEVLRELKADKETSGVPVVIISSADNREIGLDLGAAEYLEKPINREQLINCLERIKTGPRPRRGTLKVLLIDEDEEALEGPAEYLKKHGFLVFATGRDAEAFTLVWNIVPDVIVIRVREAGGGNLEFIKNMNRLSTEMKTPVIIFTSDESVIMAGGLFGSGVKLVFHDHIPANETLLSEIRLVETA
ncbi:MAG: MCP four helix bundle domain-containing protein [Deltaproteobacteria bacterium]|nr:MCP four helix bundle domain-containing protein [Deltaproteobacteria bacterium]